MDLKNNNDSVKLDEPRSYYCVGFFGAGNFGDELLCQSIVDLVGQSHSGRAKFLIASSNTAITRSNVVGPYELARGLFPNQQFFLWLWQRLLRVRNSDELLLGGGGLFNRALTDITIFRYTFEVALAVYLNKPYKIIGIEIGDYRTQRLLDYTHFCLSNSQLVYCRDPESAARANSICPNSHTLVAPDITMGAIGSLLTRAPKPPAELGSYALVNSMALHRQNKDILRGLLHSLACRYDTVALAGSQQGELSSLQNSLSGDLPRNVRFFENRQLHETLSLYYNAQLMVAERFHGVMTGLFSPNKLIAIERTSKVRNLCKDFREGLLGIDASRIEDLQEVDFATIPPKTSIAQKLESARAEVQTLFRDEIAAVKPFTGYSPALRRRARQIILEILREGVRSKFSSLKGRIFKR